MNELLSLEMELALSPREITEIVEAALAEFPRGAIEDEFVDGAFDIIYEAVEKALRRISQ